MTRLRQENGSGVECMERPRTLKFQAGGDFQRELRGRVDQYFERTGLTRRDCPRMYLKTVLVMGWTVAAYVLLVFFATDAWSAVPLAVALGLGLAAVGFNVQHDGSHRAYSNHAWVNRLMSMSIELLGGSSYVWARKHNTIHHTYSNITGHDGDIDLGIVGRLSPHQPRLGFHRFQHFYLWVLYCVLPLKWQLYDDFHDVIVGRVSGQPMPRPRGWDLITFLGGKTTFFLLAFVVPLMLHSPWSVLAMYVVVSLVQGFTLSIVFQLAHCVEAAAFPLPEEGTSRMAVPWSVHQIETAVDYARGNRALSWLVGGLNFQIEHHLFPDICHIHYPALSRIVEEFCREWGLQYSAHETFRSATRSHYRWLRRMGRED